MKTPTITEEEIQDAIAAHQSRNLALSELLKKKGVNLGEPRPVELHFWTWSEKDAVELSTALKKRGFKILVQRPAVLADDAPRWNVEAAIRQSPQLTMRREFTDELVRVAALCGGRYDGWGTSV